jgi:hypothetical protein
MTTDITTFKSNALVSADLFKKLMDMNKTLAGGTGGTSRRISIKGGRFREMVNGEQVRVNSSGSLNVVMLATSKIGRTYYEGTYDPENPSAPTCWSPDSEKPDAAVPAEQRKANACRDCPMNIKGSGQGDGRACRFSARLAVAIEGSYDKVYQIQLPATSLFGDAKDNKMGMQAYAKYMTANETPLIAVVTQMYFDENSETPKLYFRPLRPLDNEELQEILQLAEHADVQKAITLTVYQQDKGDESGSGSKSYNPKKQAIEIEDAPKAEKKSAPKKDPEQLEMKFDAPVEEPKRVEAKATTTAEAPEKLDSVLSAWDD